MRNKQGLGKKECTKVARVWQESMQEKQKGYREESRQQVLGTRDYIQQMAKQGKKDEKWQEQMKNVRKESRMKKKVLKKVPGTGKSAQEGIRQERNCAKKQQGTSQKYTET